MEPIPFAGSELGGYRHVCAFFNSPQEEYATLLPFVRDGLERGERAYHVLPARYRQEHLDQLRSAGIDVRAAQQRRQLEVATPEEVYLRNGRFSKEAMLEVIQEALKAGPTLGFPLTRLIAHAEAVLQDGSVANEWIEYETRLNDVLPHYRDPVICTYDANLFYTTKSSGMGMGLSVCRSIIDAHGGRLWAEANEPRGAVFQFTLPGA